MEWLGGGFKSLSLVLWAKVAEMWCDAISLPLGKCFELLAGEPASSKAAYVSLGLQLSVRGWIRRDEDTSV